MKTQEELNQIKTEYESFAKKLQELTVDELMQVTGGYPDPQGEYLTFDSLDNHKESCPYSGTSNCKYNNDTKTSCPYYNDYKCFIVIQGFFL